MQPLQAAASCITSRIFRPSQNGYRAGDGHSLALNETEPVDLRMTSVGADRPSPPKLSASLAYDVIQTPDPERGPWKVRTAGYRYHVISADDQEVLLFHWHPAPNGRVNTPHVHVGTSVLAPTGALDHSVHVPTGRVAFEEVVAFLIAELRVLASRPDHVEVLGKHLEAFRRYKTW
jgi:hypothetical protein